MKICICIPIYKQHLTRYECESLKQLYKIVGTKYSVFFVCPKTLNIDEYNNITDNKYKDARFIDSYFKSVYTYSELCTSTAFYNRFKSFDYMFIYQLDGWIFYDSLEKFAEMDYDWIGSPWVINGIEGVGNGGVCLRKISTCLSICKEYGKTSEFEDQYFCKWHEDEMNIAPIEVALQFGLCSNSHNKYFKPETPCPMVAHQIFNTNHYEYWQQYIIYSNGSTLPDKVHKKFNVYSLEINDYANHITNILKSVRDRR